MNDYFACSIINNCLSFIHSITNDQVTDGNGKTNIIIFPKIKKVSTDPLLSIVDDEDYESKLGQQPTITIVKKIQQQYLYACVCLNTLIDTSMGDADNATRVFKKGMDDLMKAVDELSAYDRKGGGGMLMDTIDKQLSAARTAKDYADDFNRDQSTKYLELRKFMGDLLKVRFLLAKLLGTSWESTLQTNVESAVK
jgi:hypothetical protein